MGLYCKVLPVFPVKKYNTIVYSASDAFLFNLLLCLGQLNVSLISDSVVIIMFHSPNTSGALIRCLISESAGVSGE